MVPQPDFVLQVGKDGGTTHESTDGSKGSDDPDGLLLHNKLYRNNGDGTFSDVTRGSGLEVPLYGMGGAAADFDNDGHVDVYLTALGPNRLFKGRGDGTFADVTAAAGVGASTTALTGAGAAIGAAA